MKPQLILVSHGMMAEETLRSAQMICGPQEDVHAVCMREEDGLDGFRSKLAAQLAQLGECSVIIAADLYGGTPCNVVASAFLEGKDIQLISGLNLAMVLEYAGSQTEDADELADMLTDIGKFGIRRVQPVALSEDDEDEIEA